MSKLSAENVEQACRWREAGRSCQWIGRRLGVSAGAINYQCLKHGAVSPRATGRSETHGWDRMVGKDGRTFRRFTDDDDRQMLSLREAGRTVAQIAENMGRGRTSIAMRIMLLGQHEAIAE